MLASVSPDSSAAGAFMRRSVSERVFSAVFTVLVFGVWGAILVSYVKVVVCVTEL
jgi:hypothetical protein